MQNPLVIYFTKSPTLKTINDISYKNSYIHLAKFAQERSIDLRFVIGEENYSNGKFLSSWKFINGTPEPTSQSFYPHIVYVRSRIYNLKFKRKINNVRLENICRDKLLSYLTFPKFIKKTLLATKDNTLNIGKLKTDLIVLKPRYGSNGDDVKILSKRAISSKDISTKELIAQEFIDSSAGITGLITRRHELRIYVMNGDIKAGYIRVPAKDSYLANISKGATEKLINLNQIPYSATYLQRQIDNTFKEIVPRLYTIDIMYEKGEPWVVELNDNPGMPDINVQPFTDNYLNALLDLLSS